MGCLTMKPTVRRCSTICILYRILRSVIGMVLYENINRWGLYRSIWKGKTV